MIAKPEIGESEDGSWYGLGWYVRAKDDGVNLCGSMPGTFSYLTHHSSGMSYCLILNRREEKGSPEFDSLYDRIDEAAGKVESWPDVDLFPDYF